jgi:hypothetical protein
MSTPKDKRYVSVKDLKEILSNMPDDLPVLFRLGEGEFLYKEPSIRLGTAEHKYGGFWGLDTNNKNSYEVVLLE